MDKQKYFNMFKNYKRMCSNKIAEIASYDNWSDEFCRSEVKDLYSKLIEAFKDIDFTKFTMEELKEFDFQMAFCLADPSTARDENIILMPVWALDCLKNETVLSSMSGEEFIFNKERGLDKDIRMGVTAYGFNKSQLRDSRLNDLLKD
jgi:hypothetical protein